VKIVLLKYCCWIDHIASELLFLICYHAIDAVNFLALVQRRISRTTSALCLVIASSVCLRWRFVQTRLSANDVTKQWQMTSLCRQRFQSKSRLLRGRCWSAGSRVVCMAARRCMLFGWRAAPLVDYTRWSPSDDKIQYASIPLVRSLRRYFRLRINAAQIKAYMER